MLSSIWCFFRIKNSAEVLERNPTCQTCGPNFGTFTGFPLPSKVQNYVGSSPAAAWGHMCNSRFLSQRQRTELLAKFSNAVHGTEIVGVPSSQLKQALRTCVCWGCKSHSTITSMVGHIPSICLSAPQEHQRCHLVWSKSLWRSQAAFNESKKIHSCSYQFTTEASLCWRYNVIPCLAQGI